MSFAQNKICFAQLQLTFYVIEKAFTKKNGLHENQMKNVMKFGIMAC